MRRLFWTAALALALTFACGGGRECAGPSGLCISPPGVPKDGGLGDELPSDSGAGGVANGGTSAGSEISGGAIDSGNGGTLAFLGSGGAASNAGGSSGQGDGGCLGCAGGVSQAGTSGLAGNTRWQQCPAADAFVYTCGGSPVFSCDPDPIVDAGGADGGTIDGSGGDAGAAACHYDFECPEAQVCVLGICGTRSFVVLDDFEDGDDRTEFAFGGRGLWFTANDGSGLQFPSAACFASSDLPGPLRGVGRGHRALHSFGSGFSILGAEVGVHLFAEPNCQGPLDVTGATGVRFWARAATGATGSAGTALLRFAIRTTGTGQRDGSLCPPPTNTYELLPCDDALGALLTVPELWAEFFVPFAALSQGTAGFDPAQVEALVWSARSDLGDPAACFDFWIDDVAFYRDP